MLSVSEIFGPTIQGEGPSQGKPVIFLRLGLCNLDCRWCDTPFTWDWLGKNGKVYDKASEIHRLPLDEISTQILRLANSSLFPIRRLVISGGEPMIQKKRLAPLIGNLAWHGFQVEIETNGTLSPSSDEEGEGKSISDLAREGIVSLNCSPKLMNSGIEESRRLVPEVLQEISTLPSIYKFVITSPEDLEEVDQIVTEYLPGIQPDRIYIMPEGTETQEIMDQLEWVMEEASSHGWSVSPRLHVLAYGNRRGV